MGGPEVRFSANEAKTFEADSIHEAVEIARTVVPSLNNAEFAITGNKASYREGNREWVVK